MNETTANDPLVRGTPIDTPNLKPVMLITEYEIKKGDSFMRIARTLYGDERRARDIQDANPDVDPWNLQIGQKIKLPEPISPNGAVKKTNAQTAVKLKEGQEAYVVQKGDTLVEISEKFYGKSSGWKRIYDANRDRIRDPDLLQVGIRLIIP